MRVFVCERLQGLLNLPFVFLLILYVVTPERQAAPTFVPRASLSMASLTKLCTVFPLRGDAHEFVDIDFTHVLVGIGAIPSAIGRLAPTSWRLHFTLLGFCFVVHVRTRPWQTVPSSVGIFLSTLELRVGPVTHVTAPNHIAELIPLALG